jgi:hypothetical protein
VFLEIQDDLAHGLEAEMPGFDDAGVHRPDRDLDDAGAVRVREGIVVIGRRRRRFGRLEVRAQRIFVFAPGAVTRPAP